MLEQMHHAVFPATQMCYANIETKALISKLQSDACAEAQELHNTIYRLQQRNMVRGREITARGDVAQHEE